MATYLVHRILNPKVLVPLLSSPAVNSDLCNVTDRRRSGNARTEKTIVLGLRSDHPFLDS